MSGKILLQIPKPCPQQEDCIIQQFASSEGVVGKDNLVPLLPYRIGKSETRALELGVGEMPEWEGLALNQGLGFCADERSDGRERWKEKVFGENQGKNRERGDEGKNAYNLYPLKGSIQNHLEEADLRGNSWVGSHGCCVVRAFDLVKNKKSERS